MASTFSDTQSRPSAGVWSTTIDAALSMKVRACRGDPDLNAVQAGRAILVSRSRERKTGRRRRPKHAGSTRLRHSRRPARRQKGHSWRRGACFPLLSADDKSSRRRMETEGKSCRTGSARHVERQSAQEGVRLPVERGGRGRVAPGRQPRASGKGVPDTLKPTCHCWRRRQKRGRQVRLAWWSGMTFNPFVRDLMSTIPT